MTDEEAETLAGCLLWALAFAISPLSMLWKAFVIRRLWQWFIVTCFGAPMIGYATAIGITLLVSLIHQQSTKKSDHEEKAWYTALRLLLDCILGPGIVLLIGLIVHLFQ